MTPLMSEWMWQKTLTIPGFVNRNDLDAFCAKRPRSNDAVFESEKTLWKSMSRLGNSDLRAPSRRPERGA